MTTDTHEPAPAAPPVPSAPAAVPVPPAPAAPAGISVGRRRHPVIRVLRLLGAILVPALLLVVLLLGLVLGTQSGLRTALALAADLAPGLIQVGKAQGRVLGRLHLEDVQIWLPDLDLRLGSFDLDWSPLAVVMGTLRIARVAARNVDVVTTPSEAAQAAAIVLPQVALPLQAEIGEALVENLRVLHREVAAPLFVLDRAALGARVTGSDLDLIGLELAAEQYGLKARAAGQAQLTGQYPLDLKLDWDLTMPPAVQIAGRGHLGGDLGRLVVAYDLTGSVQVKLSVQVDEVLRRPRWDGVVQVKGVRVPDFQTDALEVAVRGRLETHGNLAAATLTGSLDGTAPNHEDFGHLTAALDAQWQDRRLDLRTLDLTESVSGARFSAKGDLDLNPSPGTFKLVGAWERLRWPLTGAVIATAPQGRVQASGTFDAYDYAVSGTVQGSAFPAIDLDLWGQGDAKGTRISALRMLTLGGSLEAAGRLTWAPDLTWDLKAEAKDLNPSVIVQGVEDRIGFSLATKGGLAGFSYDLTAAAQGLGLPPTRLLLGGTGDLQGTEIVSLRLDVLKGRIDGRARVAWDPAVAWEADLAAVGVDPGSYAPEWPGRIDGRISSRGTLEAKSPNLTATLIGIQGTLRGYPITAAGQVQMAAGTIRIDGLRAASGPSSARVDGVINEKLDLRFELASPDLASLMPRAKGSVQARGKVQGGIKGPTVALEIEAKDAALAGQGIARLMGSVDLALTPEGPLRVQLDGQGLTAGGLHWERLEVRGDGSVPNHRLSVVATGQPLSIRLEAAVGLKLAAAGPAAYRGTLSRLDLDSASDGNWRLQKAMPLSLIGPKVAAGPLCLRNGKGSEGCLGFDQTDPGEWTATIDLDPLGAELVQDLLPANLAAQGAARVKGRFTAKGPVLTGSALAELPQGRLRLDLGQARFEELDLSQARLTLDASARGLRARLDLPLRGLGQLGASVDLPGWRLDAPARPDQPLRGAVHGGVAGLARFSNLVPNLTGITGKLALDFDLGGTLSRPGVKGQATLRGFGAEVALFGTKITNLNVTLAAPALERLTIQGQCEVGGRRLWLSGDAASGADGLSGQLLIVGERLKVADTKEYQVTVSPHIEIGLTPQGAQVRGEIKVPEARIRPRKLPAGTLLPSPDIVLVDQTWAHKLPFPVDLDLRLKLGNDVTIDAFGVRGRLIGDLRIRQAPGREMLGDGQLAIVDGVYRFNPGIGLGTDLIPILSGLGTELGTPLTITQGLLVFSSSPIGNPGLLLMAQRESGSLNAGVRVVGTLRNSRFAFFSESDPGMKQAEITKYLLTGIAPRADGGQGGEALAVGTYVAPNLYMEYESGIGDSKNAVKLRYDLSRSIELEAESGSTPGADIFYKFER